MLSSDEQARRERFRFQIDREIFASSRVLLRTVLSRYAPIPPVAWRFDVDAYGKPEIANRLSGQRLRFSLSHTRGLVGCAVTWVHDLGLDIEKHKPEYPDRGVMRQCYSEREMAVVLAAAGPEQSRLFLQFWTLKEAYLKARGVGLYGDLRAFEFDLAASTSPSIRATDAAASSATGWHFEVAYPTAQHVLAVAVQDRTHDQIRVSVHGAPWEQG